MATAVKESVAKTSIRELLDVKAPAESIEWLNLLIYGEPGAGKTYLCGTAQDHPDTKPILIIDVEGGTITLRRKRDVDVKQVRTMKDIEDIHSSLRKDIDQYYKTVIIDSLTELQKLDMRTVQQEEYNRQPEKTDIYVPSQRAWGKSGERVRMIVRAFRDLPCNTIVTCLMAYEKDEKTNITTYFPSVPGKLRSELPGFFDVVGYLRAVEERGENNETVIRRVLQTAKTSRVIAKDRTGALPDVLNDPTIPLIWDLIKDSDSDS